jgi:hypothetical protein
MWSRIRTVMMWLLMAALPVQSWAVATMVNCGPSHHRMAPSAHEHSSHSHERVAAGHAHELDHDHDHDHGQHADEAPADTDPQPLSLGKFKCSACATCCLGMALPSAILTFDASVSSDTIEPGMPQGHAVFLTAGPERPPRTFLA